MGYLTFHQLETDDGKTAEHAAAISERSGYGACFEDTIKWYDEEQNMRDYSKRHPSVLFTISGEGEEAGDIWKAYYRDGKMLRRKAEIVLQPFDESLLE